jgi:prevent-host-death family protein
MTMVNKMDIQISKSRFKARALELFREVESTGGTMIITDHGRPTIEVRPYRKVDRNPLEILHGSVMEYQGPIEPVGEGDWEAIE